MKIKDNNLFRIGLAYTLILVIVQFLQALIIGVVQSFWPSLAENGDFIMLLSFLPLYLVALPIGMLILGKKDDEPICKTKMKTSHFFGAIAVSFALLMIGNLIGRLFMLVFAFSSGTDVADDRLQEVVMSSSMLMTFITTVVVAPIGEEFLFRRLIIDRTRRYGELPAVLLSASMFALFHLNVYQLFYAFLLGAVFGYIYIKTGKLRYTIALHATVNFFGGVYSSGLLRLLDAAISAEDITALTTAQLAGTVIGILGLLLYGIFILASFIATIVIACCNIKKLKLEKGEGVGVILRSPMIIVFAALCILLTVFAMML